MGITTTKKKTNEAPSTKYNTTTDSFIYFSVCFLASTRNINGQFYVYNWLVPLWIHLNSYRVTTYCYLTYWEENIFLYHEAAQIRIIWLTDCQTNMIQNSPKHGYIGSNIRSNLGLVLSRLITKRFPIETFNVLCL